jgi:hypothetical protein
MLEIPAAVDRIAVEHRADNAIALMRRVESSDLASLSNSSSSAGAAEKSPAENN